MAVIGIRPMPQERQQGQQSTPPYSRTREALIVDDHMIVAQALSSLLRLRFDLQANVANSKASALDLIRTKRFALALIDLELQDGNGLDVLEALSRSQPRCALVVVSGHVDQFYCPAMLRNRIAAVIDKAQVLQDLSNVLYRLFSSELKPLDWLTRREADVYRLMGTGFSCKQIAENLGLTLRTVETHRKHIASKLGVSGAALMHRATLDMFCSGLELEPTENP